MHRRTSLALAALALAAVLTAPQALAGSSGTLDARAAFELLKGLDGEWQFPGDGQGIPPGTVNYRVTANGSAVLETLMPGTEHEMITLYHLDGDQLVLTHYCVLGNQPEMKLVSATANPKELRFAFTGGRNVDPAKGRHIHSGRLRFREDGSVASEWAYHVDGQPAGAHAMVMTRQK